MRVAPDGRGSGTGATARYVPRHTRVVRYPVALTAPSTGLLVLVAVIGVGDPLSSVLSGRRAAAEEPAITHGPMLGAVSADSAAIWLRASRPAEVRVEVRAAAGDHSPPIVRLAATDPEQDNTATVRFHGLAADTPYRYEARVGDSRFEGTFHTTSPAWRDREIRLVFGGCYKQTFNRMPTGDSVFGRMAARHPDCIVFLGDFPYTDQGRREELAAGHREIRGLPGFRDLTAATPTYGIYDDHDFGTNDCDGTHPFAAEALETFTHFWPNPSYGEDDVKGISTSFVIGPVEVFLLDGRYHARQAEGTMLGRRQFAWLCRRLEASTCRYKVLASGTPFDRVKVDCWAGPPFIRERDALFAFIRDRGITGVIGISGDMHRSDVHRIPLGGGRFFYDFTAGALGREQKSPSPESERPASMIHSYGAPGDNNMFGEIEFHPPNAANIALVYRSWSARYGVVYEHVLSPADLGIDTPSQNRPALPAPESHPKADP